jgi:hypothetical protein
VSIVHEIEQCEPLDGKSWGLAICKIKAHTIEEVFVVVNDGIYHVTHDNCVGRIDSAIHSRLYRVMQTMNVDLRQKKATLRSLCV